VKTNDSTYSCQHDSSRSSLLELRREDTGSSDVLVNKVQVEEIEDEDRSSKKLKMQHGSDPLRVSMPPPFESSEELSHYCALVKNLLHEIEAVQYKLGRGVRSSFRDGIKRSHRRTTDILTAKHGHERICRIFSQAWAEKIDVSFTLWCIWQIN
jgi:hypothetical protein